MGTFPSVAPRRLPAETSGPEADRAGPEAGPDAYAADPVVEVVVSPVALPLERAVRLGPQTIGRREYAVLELRTAGGCCGAAVGLTRGLPVSEMLDGLAPELVGADPGRRRAVLAGLARRRPNAALGLTRALGLVDVALWDLLAKRAALPLWRLLGGSSERVPLVAVGGYFADRRSVADIADELRRLEAAGFTHLKVHAEDPATVAALRSALGPGSELAVDLGMSCSDLVAARRLCRDLDGLGLWFIEDPFPPERSALTAELAGELATPVAAGEDALGLEMLVRLADAADVLRIDATASGGVDTVLAAADHAAGRGRPVVTHSIAELHGQIAGGSASVQFAETVPYDSGANPLDRLLATTQPVEAGHLVLSELPGNGLVLDGAAVERFATRRTSHRA